MDNFVNITDVCSEIFAGGDAPKPNMSVTKTDEYKIPIFSNGEADNGLYGYTNFARVTKPSITVSARGTIGFVAVRNEPFVPIVRLISLTPDPEKIEIRYLYYAIQNYKFDGSGTSIPQLTVPMLKKYSFPLPTKEQQLAIIDQLDNVCNLISLRRQQLAKLDEFVKSRFVEMFGTLSSNEHHYPMSALKDVCRKITDGKHGGCEQEADSGYYYVGAREIYDGEIHYDTAPQITKTDFEKDYRRCNLEQGDFVLVNTGATIGKSAIAKHPLTECTLLQKSVAMFKIKPEIISAVFLKYCYEANPEMYTVESASAQPNLLLSRINSTLIYIPPIERQEQFAAFVEQIDKSKFEIQKSLEKLEMLKKALMQKYFG